MTASISAAFTTDRAWRPHSGRPGLIDVSPTGTELQLVVCTIRNPLSIRPVLPKHHRGGARRLVSHQGVPLPTEGAQLAPALEWLMREVQPPNQRRHWRYAKLGRDSVVDVTYSRAPGSARVTHSFFWFGGKHGGKSGRRRWARPSDRTATFGRHAFIGLCVQGKTYRGLGTFDSRLRCVITQVIGAASQLADERNSRL